MESERSERESPKDSSTDKKPSDDNNEEMSFSKLPHEPLRLIFLELPIVDRFRIQRVNKMCHAVSKQSWLSCKSLTFKVDDWGYKYWSKGGIDQASFKKILKRCSKSLRRIDFSSYYGPDKTKLTKKNGSLFIMITKYCPNITALNIGRLEVDAKGIECLASMYSKLTEFCIGKSYAIKAEQLSRPLTLLFRKNKNLQHVELNIASDGKCLLELNPAVMKKLAVVNGFGSEKTICLALKKFKNLHSFVITNYANYADKRQFDDKEESYMNVMLKAIRASSQSLQELTIRSILFNTIIDSKIFVYFQNLRKLVIEGDAVKLDLGIAIEHCKKLTCVNLFLFPVTDDKMASIMRLPELRELHLSNLRKITDAIFVNRMPSLKVFSCIQCPHLTEAGLRSLLENSSENLERLTIAECPNINLANLSNVVREATGSRSNGPLLKILVKQTDELLLVVDKIVTRLSDYVELVEFVYE
ncbi:hypothetical protein TSAR_007089 [Trichomalopsis sarcophagae]|uniref:F-box domain-containing protein n=1 Tax=Trichomalopsis sarcophagae TaxID=543379 RepID=A0A232FDF3_9HYME|nr:hypothetical protein TSAR_007089 [Trichomalopsis sarcophagae]